MITHLLWLGAIVLFTLLELATEQLVSIWFVFGGIVGLFASILHFRFLTQLMTFAISSAIALILFRPVIYQRLSKKLTHTNADRVLDRLGRVLETVDGERGRVRADGKDWSARSFDGGTIEKGEQVRVLRIEGVKLIVERQQEEKSAPVADVKE